MLYLLTGAPGSGKTLSAVQMIMRVKAETPDRLIYVANIDGLDIPGVINLEDDDVLNWHTVCEKNSIIFVDEAQKYWRAQRSGEPSKAITEMETHRHDGIDIVMMTQHPTFLHANIRKLNPTHVHLLAYTKSSALRWEWRECHDDVADTAARATGEFVEWHYPKEYYGKYVSATQHTKRIKRPLKQVIARAAVWVSVAIMVGGLGWVGWFIYAKRDLAGKAFSAKPSGSVSALQPGQVGPSMATDGHPVYSTPKEYVMAQVPRVESMPWSAPIYDGQAVTQHPRLFCMAVERPGRCACITEQGTRYRASDAVCRQIASDGPPYDPYLPQKQLDQPPAPAAAVDASPSIGSPSVGLASASMAHTSGGSTGPMPRGAYIPPEYMPPNR
jgi:zona occludens toxin